MITVVMTQPGSALLPDGAMFLAAGGTQEFSALVGEGTDWTAAVTGTGFSIDKASGTGDDIITVTAAENTESSDRAGDLTLTYGVDDEQAAVVLAQHALEIPQYETCAAMPSTACWVYPATANWGAAATAGTTAYTCRGGGTHGLAVGSLVIASGCELMEYYGTGRGFLYYIPPGSTLNSDPIPAGFYCLGYPDVEYTFRLILCPGTYGGACDSVTVDTAALCFGAAGGQMAVAITAEGGWTAEVTGTGFSIDNATGTGNGTVTVTAAENSGSSRINGTLTIVRGHATSVIQLTQGVVGGNVCVPFGTATITPAAVHSAGVNYTNPSWDEMNTPDRFVYTDMNTYSSVYYYPTLDLWKDSLDATITVECGYAPVDQCSPTGYAQTPASLEWDSQTWVKYGYDLTKGICFKISNYYTKIYYHPVNQTWKDESDYDLSNPPSVVPTYTPPTITTVCFGTSTPVTLSWKGCTWDDNLNEFIHTFADEMFSNTAYYKQTSDEWTDGMYPIILYNITSGACQ